MAIELSAEYEPSLAKRLGEIERRATALANINRVLILHWLRSPQNNFPPQVHADVEIAGICGVFIAEKLGVSQSTASQHLNILAEAGYVRKKRIGKWTYFKLADEGIVELSAGLQTLRPTA